MKQCPCCKELKEDSEFYKNSRTKDGLQYWCKLCNKVYKNKYIKENKDRINQYAVLWRLKEGKEAISQRNADYRARNRGYFKEYRIANKEAIALYQSGYQKTPQGKANNIRGAHKRRDHLRRTPCTLTFEQWQKILKYQKNKCVGCNKKFTKRRPPTRDHIIPISKGGGLTYENVQALCLSCNSRKRDKIDHNKIISWGVLV